MFAVELHFLGGLCAFLHRELRREPVVQRRLTEKTSVKDVIEACGLPHPEVDLIVAYGGDAAAGHPVDFHWAIEETVRLEIHPVPAPPELFPESPRLQVRRCTRFVADGHLGKLARNLRLLGLDVAYERDADDPRLLAIMVAEDRALLTRDRPLLMHSIVRHGYCPRSPHADEQTREVLRRFDLDRATANLTPFSRCVRCNGPVHSVPKEEVLAPLADEPLTLRYYEHFYRCASCGQIYWNGTHFEKLAARVGRLLGAGRAP